MLNIHDHPFFFNHLTLVTETDSQSVIVHHIVPPHFYLSIYSSCAIQTLDTPISAVANIISYIIHYFFFIFIIIIYEIRSSLLKIHAHVLLVSERVPFQN